MTAVADLVARLEKLEAESTIRAVVVRYFELCDRLDADTPMAEMAELFAKDAIWAGKGARYASAFGERTGRDAIIAMIDSYRVPVAHFAMNAHFLSSETINVDGASATGKWMMLQTSTYADGTSDLRSAKLTIGFAMEDGRWRISRFETENIFSRPVCGWDSADQVPVPETTK